MIVCLFSLTDSKTASSYKIYKQLILYVYVFIVAFEGLKRGSYSQLAVVSAEIVSGRNLAAEEAAVRTVVTGTTE